MPSDFTVEYDDGAGPKVKSQPEKYVTRHGRERGFYVRGRRLPVGFMRVGEMEPLTKFLEDICQPVIPVSDHSTSTPSLSSEKPSLMTRLRNLLK